MLDPGPVYVDQDRSKNTGQTDNTTENSPPIVVFRDVTTAQYAELPRKVLPSCDALSGFAIIHLGFDSTMTIRQGCYNGEQRVSEGLVQSRWHLRDLS